MSSGSWNLQRTETYGYDANLDYLTSANYGDGLSNATPSWTYDAAGNRASDSTNSGTWSYDNLNRMTAMPGVTVGTMTNDILGNRTAKTVSGVSTAYGWDDLNRMTSLTIGSNNSNAYVYRADGMRVSKTATGSASSQSSTVYRYDGQMGIEDVEKNSSGTITAITRMALGARGIDAISRTTSSGTSVAYPLYDAHGNNVGMLSKSGSSWSMADERSYDAWGKVRSGGSTGDQKGRYCASLGHKQDDESDLVYMRARYYEPSSGRFLSQDSDHHGSNWYIYCNNDPVNAGDYSGKCFFLIMALLGALIGLCTYLVYQTASGNDITFGGAVAATFVGAAAGLIGAFGAAMFAVGATMSAAEIGAAYVWAIVSGEFSVGVGALGGAMEKGINNKMNETYGGPALKAVSCLMGGTIMAAIYLGMIDNE